MAEFLESGQIEAEFGWINAHSGGKWLKLGLLLPIIQEKFVGVDPFILV